MSITALLGIVTTVVKVIILLGFLVLIHEGGHFIVAKKSGVRVNEFAIGFGPTIWSKQGKETKYAIRAIPLGGFVNMEGEEERSEKEGSFSKASIPKRIAIVAAGALVNIAFALIVYFILAFSAGDFQTTTITDMLPQIQEQGLMQNDKIVAINGKRVHIPGQILEALEKSNGEELNITVKRNDEIKDIKVKPIETANAYIGIRFASQNGKVINEIQLIQDNMPAKEVGIEKGDKITKINNEDVKTPYEVVEKINNNGKKELSVSVLRNNEELTYTLMPVIKNTYSLGIDLAMAENTIANKAYYSFWYTGEFLSSAGESIKMLFTGKVKPDQLTGPIGIGKIVNKSEGIREFIELLVLISLSLGVTNLLPFPPLDGGKIVLLAIEGIRRKPLKENLEIGLQMVGFVLLIGLSIYVGYNDVIRKM